MGDDDPGYSSATTRDAFFGGRLILEQPAKGHRSGTDAVLLAAAVPRGLTGHVVDAGAGVGAVGLGVALSSPDARVTLVEADATCIALAQANIASNRLEACVRVAACNLLSSSARRDALSEAADIVLTNPPFHRPDQVRASPDMARRSAHVLASADGLDRWFGACLACLAPKGCLLAILPAAALPEALAALGTRLGGITVLPIHPRADAPATRILLRGRRGSRAPFGLAPPLVLHVAEGFTPRAAALHRGDEVLDW